MTGEDESGWTDQSLFEVLKHDGLRKKAVVKAREELTAEGLLRDTGRRKNGQIVWEPTERGRQEGLSAMLEDFSPTEGEKQ
jgi:hypothetical protein